MAPTGRNGSRPSASPAGRHRIRAARPEWNRPILHAPKLRAGAASPASGLREPRCETGTMVFTSAAPAASPSPYIPVTLRHSAAPAEGPYPAHRGIRRRQGWFDLAPGPGHCSTARAEGQRPFHRPGAVGTPGSTASSLPAQPVRGCQFSTMVPSQRLSRELELAHDVAAVAGFSAGVPPGGWFPATRQRLRTQPLALAGSNPKPSAS